jgi:hypothetical protein
MKKSLGFIPVVLLATVVALLSAGCGLMAPTTERYVAPPTGTNWVNSRRDTGSYGSEAVQVPGKYLGEQMWQGKKVHAFDTTDGVVYGTVGDELGFITQVKGNSPVLTWDPPAAWRFPLEVGKSWTRKYSLTVHAANRTFAIEESQVVEAYEDTTVPAGTFKAWRVRSTDNLGNENVQWYAPELGIFLKQSLRRTAKNAAGPGTREFELVSYKRP